jgi:uncharacterized membrane protein (DUF4010 family)
MLGPSIDATDTLIGFATALGVGLLVGVERERTKGSGMGRGAAGVRTFSLLALAGSIAALLGPVATAVAGVFVALAMYASYRRTQVDDPGLTTEVAMLVTYFLGLLAMRSPALAGGLGVVVALILASKAHLHRFTRDSLSQQELHDALMFVAAAFVVLPLLPDRTIDPWNSVNPRRLWILVVAVMGMSSAGYVALRVFGSRLGLAIAGLVGGFVSSTATIAAMGDKAKTTPELAPAFACAGLLSNVGTVVQLAIVIGALSPTLLVRASWPLAVAGTVAITTAALSSWRAFSTANMDVDVSGKRPFEPLQVLSFAALLGAVVFLAAIARYWFGDDSLPWVLAASGWADVHAAAVSAAQLASSQQLDQHAAMVAISAALAANSLMKCAMATIKGGVAYARRVVPGIVLMVLAFAAAVLLQH